MNDGKILDPQKPESLVYEWRNGKQTVVAAMYMLPFGSHFTDIPDVGGALTQWHVHRDLCLTDDPEQKVVSGLTSVDGACPPGTDEGRRHADAARVDRPEPVRTVRRARGDRRRAGGPGPDPALRHRARLGVAPSSAGGGSRTRSRRSVVYTVATGVPLT